MTHSYAFVRVDQVHNSRVELLFLHVGIRYHHGGDGRRRQCKEYDSHLFHEPSGSLQGKADLICSLLGGVLFISSSWDNLIRCCNIT